MSEENFLFVRRIAHAVRDGLGPYVLKAYKFTYSKAEYLGELQKTLDRDHHFDSHDQALEELDLQPWLKAMNSSWNEVFRHKLGHTARNVARSTKIV